VAAYNDRRHTRHGSFGLVVRDLRPEADDADNRLILTAAHLLEDRPDGTQMLYTPPGPEPQSTDGRFCGSIRRRVPLYNLPTIGVDAAVVKPAQNLDCRNQLGCGMVNGIRDLWIVDDQSQGIAVKKHGAQTQVTSGELMPVAADLFVEDVKTRYNAGWWVYGDNGSEFATRGDSGAIVVDSDRRVVGMLVAVDRRGAAFVHGIKQIFTALDIELP
jgi:hypothetical protein